MRYLPWALLALGAYTFVPPLVRIATEDLPSDVVVLVTNGILVVIAGGLVLANGSTEELRRALVGPAAPTVYAAGVLLAVGIIAYYRALRVGPVSVVTPIFGIFLVTSSAIGILALNEALNARRALGIGFAVLALYLTTTS